MYMNNLEEPTGLNFADKTRYKSEVLTGHTTHLITCRSTYGKNSNKIRTFIR